MIEKPYFVILNHQKEDVYLPMIDEDDKLAMYETYEAATTAGEQNPLGEAYGFEVFELGGGV